MARSTFGGFGGDQVSLDPAGNSGFYKAAANYTTGTFWSASTGGTQYTDLIDPTTSVALTGVSTDVHGHVIPFKGPDSITEGWLDFGGGRFKVTAVDSGIFLPVATLDGRYAALPASPGAYKLYYRDGSNNPAWTTSQATVARALGWTIVTDPAYGAKGDGTTDDTAAIQAAINAVTAGGVVYFPIGSYKTTTALVVNKAMRLVGGSHVQCRIVATGCNGVNVAASTNDVQMEYLGITQAVPYTTTTNTLVGISVAGDATHSAGYHTYRSIYLSGFQTAIQSTSLQTSTFDDVTIEYSLVGIDAYGLSVNVKVTNCHIVVGAGTGTRLTGSKCIALNGQNAPGDTTARQSEGWVITGNVLFGGDIDVDLFGVANCNVAGNILDYAHVNAVRSINNGTAYSSNHDISGNYIAMAADASTTGGAVEIANTASSGSTVRGVRVAHNDFISYGTAAPYAVHTVANAAALATVTDNTFGGFQTYDVYLQSSSNICTGNHATNVAIYNYYAAAGTSNLVANNYGNVFLDNTAGYPNVYSQVGNNKWMSGAAAPTANGWGKGDRVINSAPAVGSPKAWTCTVAGSPGTWVSEGNL